MLFLPILLTFCQLLFAQQPEGQWESSKWQDGVAAFADGSSRNGKIQYDFKNELVIFDSGKEVKTYDANQIVRFKTINDSTKKETHYFALPLQGRLSKRKPISFYELIHENGSLAILSRHEYIYRERDMGLSDPSGVYWSQGAVATEKVREILYLATKSSGIVEVGSKLKDKNSFFKPEIRPNSDYRDPQAPSLQDMITRDPSIKYNISKKMLETVMQKQFEAVMIFAKESGNRLNTVPELIAIIDYYAQLKSP